MLGVEGRHRGLRPLGVRLVLDDVTGRCWLEVIGWG
jgi:hypothetical protein